MADFKKVVYLVLGSCYFSDDPDHYSTKVWYYDVYENKFDSFDKVMELLDKEEARVKNLSPDDWDFRIRNQYAVVCIRLFG